MKKAIYFLLAFAALAQGVLWINVFSLLHHGPLAYIGGIPAGIAIVGLVVYAANSLPRVQSKRARQVGWGVLVLLGIVEPTVLGFANYPIIMNVSVSQTGGVIISGGASMTITLALVLGALVDRSLLPAEKQERPKVKRQKLTEKPVEPTPIQQEPALYCAVAGCERNQANPKAKPFGSQAALNAHQRKHKRPIGYAVSFEPITEEQKKD